MQGLLLLIVFTLQAVGFQAYIGYMRCFGAGDDCQLNGTGIFAGAVGIHEGTCVQYADFYTKYADVSETSTEYNLTMYHGRKSGEFCMNSPLFNISGNLPDPDVPVFLGTIKDATDIRYSVYAAPTAKGLFNIMLADDYDATAFYASSTCDTGALGFQVGASPSLCTGSTGTQECRKAPKGEYYQSICSSELATNYVSIFQTTTSNAALRSLSIVYILLAVALALMA